MKIYKQYTAVLLTGGILWSTAYGITIGSDSAVSRQAFVNFTDPTNTILGFAAMENGFSLNTSSVACLFSSVFPVGGSVTLNGGTLDLDLDLRFDSDATLVNGGLINAAFRIISLPDIRTGFTIPSGFMVSDGIIYLNSDVTLNGIFRLNGSTIIRGQHYTLNLGSSGALVIGDGGTLLLDDVTIDGLHAGNMYCTDNAGTFSFDNVMLVLDDDYSFTQGRFDVATSCNISGTHVFTYQSSSASSIQSDATLFFDTGMTFSYAPSAAEKKLLIMSDQSSIVHIYETSLHSTSTGLQLTKGTLIVEGTCPVYSGAATAAEGIFLGGGSTETELSVRILPESSLDVVSGFVVYDNVST